MNRRPNTILGIEGGVCTDICHKHYSPSTANNNLNLNIRINLQRSIGSNANASTSMIINTHILMLPVVVPALFLLRLLRLAQVRLATSRTTYIRQKAEVTEGFRV